jgi:hypothetical protein
MYRALRVLYVELNETRLGGVGLVHQLMAETEAQCPPL